MAVVVSRARRRGRTAHLPRHLGGAGPLTYVLLTLAALASLFPLYWSLVVASHDNSAVSSYPPVITPGDQLWDNIRRLFNSGEVNVEFWTALENSAIVATTVTVAVVFFSALAGFAFAKLSFRGSKLLMLTVVATMMVPVQLGVIPLYIEMIEFGWVNRLHAVIAPNLVSAFGVFLMRQFIAGLPNELLDAARVDGANEWGVFRQVFLPLSWPGLATLIVFQFMWAWNEFAMPLIFVQRDELRPVSLGTMFFFGRFTADRGMIAAGVTISMIPVVILYLLLQRRFIEGITAGALKS